MQVEIRLLGGFGITVDGCEIPAEAWARRHAASLVKLLAMQPGHRLHREQVLDALWPDITPDAAAARLHKAAHYARKATGSADTVVLARDVVSLFPEADVAVDVEEFERMVAAGATADALTRYRGELLPDDRYEEWAFVPRERVQLRYRELLRREQRWDELVAIDPTDEGAHVALMARMLHADDRAGVRRQFETLERTLREELGIGPSVEAVELYEQASRKAVASTTPRHSTLADQSIHFCQTSDGVRLAYAVSGSGMPLVKASNWLTHLDYDWESPVWRHWWQGLSTRFRLVRYDERGCGLSDWDVDDFTLDAYVRDLETVVDTLALESFPLLGISQGGAIAIRYAARHPERVVKLVLYGTGAQGRWARARDDESRRAVDALGVLMRASWGSPAPGFHTIYNAMFMPDGPLELWRAFEELQTRTAAPENAARLYTSFQRADVVDEARSLRVPTLILHGRRDQLRPYDGAVELSELIADSRLVPLDSNNHILQAHEPAFAQFLAEIETFLA